MPVKLTSALPKSAEVNGLDHYLTDMVKDQRAFRPAVVFFDCQKVVDETDSGDKFPVARIRRVELVSGEDAEAVRQIAGRAFQERTGVQELPLDFDDEVAETFQSDDS